METPWRDEELLREMYENRGMSLSEIAEELNTGSTTIHRWVRRFGIETNQASDDKPPLFRTESRGYEVWRHHTNDTQHKIRHHRLLAVALYGFDSLSPTDDVHHKNRIPWDNRPENIEIVDRDQHVEIHNN